MTRGRPVPTLARVAVWMFFLAMALVSSSARAEPMDSAANALDDQAMNREFLAANFKAAKQTLQKAIQSCEKGCSVKVHGRLHRDLAVVLITGFDDTRGGESEFLVALTADPSVDLDPTFASPAVQQTFARVRAQVPRTEPMKTKGTPAGQARLEPAPEQQLRVPVPVYVELPEEHPEKLKGRVHYRMVGAGAWHAVSVHKVGKGYGAELPCDAAPKAGVLEYYVDFKDEDGEKVLAAGSKEEPFQTEITRGPVSEPPHLPHRSPPEMCAPEPTKCGSDADCSGAVCEGGICVEPKKPSRLRLGLSFAQDLPLISGKDVCTKNSQLKDGFSCFRASGSQYHGTPLIGRGDLIGSGFAIATTRLVVGLDYALSRPVSVGVRLGYTLQGGGPRSDSGNSYLPLLAEVRFAYFFSGNAHEHFSPYVTLAGGAAQVDASRGVFVGEDRTVPPPPNQIDNPDVQKLTAWKKMGREFVGAGGGIYVPVTRATGIVVELRALVLFPDSGFDFQGLAGYEVGL